MLALSSRRGTCALVVVVAAALGAGGGLSGCAWLSGFDDDDYVPLPEGAGGVGGEGAAASGGASASGGAGASTGAGGSGGVSGGGATTGGAGGSGGAGGDGCGGASGAVLKRVFVTQVGFDGNLGGVAGADLKCQQAADAECLGGTWMAYLNDSSQAPSIRLMDVGSWQLLDATVVFDSHSQLLTGPNSPINVDEQKLPVPNANVWTGTMSNGVPNLGSDCLGWGTAGADETGTSGNTQFANGSWTDNDDDNCGQINRLYCFEQ